MEIRLTGHGWMEMAREQWEWLWWWIITYLDNGNVDTLENGYVDESFGMDFF